MRQNKASMVISAGILVGKRFWRGIFLEMPDGALQVFQQKSCQIAAYAKARDHALDHKIAAMRGHGIRGHLPAFYAEPVC
jgi:hypothetical protein